MCPVAPMTTAFMTVVPSQRAGCSKTAWSSCTRNCERGKRRSHSSRQNPLPFRSRRVSPSSSAALTLGRPARGCPGGRRLPGRRRQPGRARGPLHQLQALPAELPLRPVRQGHRRHPGAPGHGLRRPAAPPPVLRRVRLRPEGHGGGGRGGRGPRDRPVQLLRREGPRGSRLGRMGPSHGYGPILCEELARP